MTKDRHSKIAPEHPEMDLGTITTPPLSIGKAIELYRVSAVCARGTAQTAMGTLRMLLEQIRPQYRAHLCSLARLTLIRITVSSLVDFRWNPTVTRATLMSVHRSDRCICLES
jgi:hypothetical protein